jgi:hypothetical protein
MSDLFNGFRVYPYARGWGSRWGGELAGFQPRQYALYALQRSQLGLYSFPPSQPYELNNTGRYNLLVYVVGSGRLSTDFAKLQPPQGGEYNHGP